MKFDSYEDYVSAQKERWRLKRTSQTPILTYKEHLGDLIERKFNSILCNGVRSHHEMECFHEIFGAAKVQGTEIAWGSENVIQCDFSSLPERLTGYDLVYTNALDHALDPEKTIAHWSSRMVPGGILVLAFNVGVPSTHADPSSFATVEQVTMMLTKCGLTIRSSFKAEGWCVIHGERV